MSPLMLLVIVMIAAIAGAAHTLLTGTWNVRLFAARSIGYLLAILLYYLATIYVR